MIRSIIPRILHNVLIVYTTVVYGTRKTENCVHSVPVIFVILIFYSIL